MTQTDLADAMGVSYQAVSNWERGNSMPDISKIPDLCRILDLNFEEMLGGESKATREAHRIVEDENAKVIMVSGQNHSAYGYVKVHMLFLYFFIVKHLCGCYYLREWI